MSTKNDTEYYVFDCDNFENVYELGNRINHVFSSINGLKPTAIVLEYGYASLIGFESIWCMFYPDEQIAIEIGNSDVRFNPTGKVVNLAITIEEFKNRKFVTVGLMVVDKGGEVA